MEKLIKELGEKIENSADLFLLIAKIMKAMDEQEELHYFQPKVSYLQSVFSELIEKKMKQAFHDAGFQNESDILASSFVSTLFHQPNM
jgi:uncharacterized membrane protein